MKIQNYQNKKGSGPFGKLCTLNSTLLNRGFTLVELMVTITVFVAVTMVVLVNQSDFNGGVILNNLAYDVALSTRQAQSYGINVRGRETNSVIENSTVVFPPYGVAFDLASNKEFVFFADIYPSVNEFNKIGNGLYDASVGTNCTGNSSPQCAEFIEKYRIQRGNFIKQLCVMRAEMLSPACKSAGEAGTLTISFRRPNPDAIIQSDIGGGSGKIISARIVLGAPEGNERTVLVYESGQISVQESE